MRRAWCLWWTFRVWDRWQWSCVSVRPSWRRTASPSTWWPGMLSWSVWKSSESTLASIIVHPQTAPVDSGQMFLFPWQEFNHPLPPSAPRAGSQTPPSEASSSVVRLLSLISLDSWMSWSGWMTLPGRRRTQEDSWKTRLSRKTRYSLQWRFWPSKLAVKRSLKTWLCCITCPLEGPRPERASSTSY